MVRARVPPRPNGEVHELTLGILGAQRAVDRRSAIGVRLVPLADNQQDRHGQPARGEQFVERLGLPIFVVSRVREQFAHRGQV